MWKNRLCYILIAIFLAINIPSTTQSAVSKLHGAPAWVKIVSGAWLIAIGTSWYFKYKNKPSETPVDLHSLEYVKTSAIDTLTYLASKSELDSLASLKSVESINKYVENWWAQNTPESAPLWREVYRERFQEADRKFGWKSDQGRVYILYGPPADRYRHPMPGQGISAVPSGVV